MIGRVLSLVVVAALTTSVSYAAKQCENVFDVKVYSPILLDDQWFQQMHEEMSSASAGKKKLQQAVQADGLLKISLNMDLIKKHSDHYTNELPVSKASDQESTGTCWINAMCNEVRNRLVAQGKVSEDFNFSRAYFQFFDQLEKTDKWIYESLEMLKPGMNKQDLVQVLDANSAIEEGGHHVNATFLIWKYGMIPSQVMPDTVSSLNSGTMLADLKTYVAQSFELVRKTYSSMKFEPGQKELSQEQRNQILAIRQKAMMGIYRILTTHLGLPPRIDQEFSYRDSKGEIKKYTPKEFAKNFAQFDPNEYVVIATSPLMRPNMGIRFEDAEEGLLPENSPDFSLKFLSVTKKRMKELIKASIDQGRTAWFAADADHDIEMNSGIMHPKIYQKNEVYGFNQKDSMPSISSEKKALFFNLTGPDHAMAIVGYDQPNHEGPIVKFKVENSWGQSVGDQGFFHMYDAWFDKYVFMVVVPRSTMTPKELQKYDNPKAGQWGEFF